MNTKANGVFTMAKNTFKKYTRLVYDVNHYNEVSITGATEL
jgi:hypothetical protein